MTPKDVWGLYLSNMCDIAFQEFHRTDLYHALQQHLDQMESDCASSFCKEDFAYIDAWVEAILAVNSAECSFMYARGYRDCTALLRQLEAQ